MELKISNKIKIETPSSNYNLSEEEKKVIEDLLWVMRLKQLPYMKRIISTFVQNTRKGCEEDLKPALYMISG